MAQPIPISRGSCSVGASPGDRRNRRPRSRQHSSNFAAIFLGIVLGVLLGTYPFHLPGVTAPVRLGLAGGPLLVAIIMSRVGRIGPVISHIPPNANAALRELGIILFLGCVGLKAGEHFFEAILHGNGIIWIGIGAIITLVPLLAVGFVASGFLNINFLSVCGLLSGSMTDPPALAFATAMTGSDASSTAYASVYPVAMILRIILAQVIIFFLAAS